MDEVIETPEAATAGTGAFLTPKGHVVRCEVWGEPVFFTITNGKDMIQKKHLQGRFYEEEELEIIRQYCRPGSVFCDIGSNIGNHALFALKFLRVAKAILFEPNPRAIEILISNLTLNGVLARCDISNLGVGLSDEAAGGLSIVAPGKNLGAGRMVEGDGDLAVIAGDSVLAGQTVDFMKIDVEGMEMQTLAGLHATIKANRPVIFIEVDRANRDAFGEWVRANEYAVKARYQRYRVNENFLLVPNKKAQPEAETSK